MEETGSTIIKCTNFCGFSVTGSSEYCQKMYENHEHQEHPDVYESGHWYDSVFSPWGAMIFAIVVGGIVSIITKHPF